MIYKYRSMKLDAPRDIPTHLLENPDQYITKVGRFLRKTSLDEIPQLFNILRGDISLIGPRPALWNQEDLIEERDRYGVHQIKPGLTGWAQINGRDELEIPVKAQFDGEYLAHVGIKMDIRCFFGTFRAVLKGGGHCGRRRQRINSKGKGATGVKKKILIITNHSYMLYRFRKELIETLASKHEVVLSMPFVGHEEDFKGMGIRCIDTKVERRGINPITDFRLIQDYRRMLKEEKPDLVITYSIKPNVYAGYLCRMMRIPYCANVQGLGTAFYKNNGLAVFVTALYRTAFRRVSTVFFENEENARAFQEKHIIPASKQTILPGAGINLDCYSYQEYPANDKVHFLYLGRIMQEKGMDELLYAIKKLHQEYGQQVVLDLVGFYEDQYKAQMEKRVDKMVEEGIVSFHGFQDDPIPYYIGADCVVLPSYHEGMSNVLLEAAALGRPIITSNIPGCKEAVEDGRTGILCKAKDGKSLYQAMKKFMQLSPKQREEMGRLGRKKMDQEFEKKKVVEMTVEKLPLE